MDEMPLLVELAPAHPYRRVENLYDQADGSDYYHWRHPCAPTAAGVDRQILP